MDPEQSWTQFNGNPPEGLWDPARVNQDYPGVLLTGGGNLAHEPYDTGNPFLENADPRAVLGINTQAGMLGQKELL